MGSAREKNEPTFAYAILTTRELVGLLQPLAARAAD